MSYAEISPGKNPPDEINAIIEIPAQGAPVKYEMNKEAGVLMVDRFLSTAMFYPANYGYVPQTLSEDGDPVDILVVTPIPLTYGCMIRCRPVGALMMTDEAGVDTKILAVPVSKLTTLYQSVESPEDLPAELLATIAHFFESYKALEKGKWVKTDGWRGAKEAKAEIMGSIKRYNNQHSESEVRI